MAEALVINTPRDLADALTDTPGVHESFNLRGADTALEFVAILAASGLAAGADVATLVVAREAFADFARELRTWFARRRSDCRDFGELRITVHRRSGPAEIELSLMSRVEGAGQDLASGDQVARILAEVLELSRPAADPTAEEG